MGARFRHWLVRRLLRVELRRDEVLLIGNGLFRTGDVLGGAGDGGGHWQMTIGKRARKFSV